MTTRRGRRGILAEMITDVSATRLTGLAAEVTYYAMLSLFPALLIVAGMLGMLDVLIGRDLATQSEQAILSFLNRSLTDRASNVTDAVSGLFEGSNGGLLTTAALIALWTVSSGYTAVIDALGIIYRVEERRSWIRIRLLAVLLSVAGLISLAVLLITMVLGPLFGLGGWLVARAGLTSMSTFIWQYLRAPTAFALLVGWATTVYHLSPDHHTPWRRDLPGGLLASALWLLVSWGLGLYLRLGMQGNQILGLLGGGLILMLWLYMISFVLLLGGELNAVLLRRRSSPPD